MGGTQCSIQTKDFTIERILSEARAAGYSEFNIYCDGEIITSPDEFSVKEGAIYVISSPDDEKNLDDVINEIATEHEKNKKDIS